MRRPRLTTRDAVWHMDIRDAETGQVVWYRSVVGSTAVTMQARRLIPGLLDGFVLHIETLRHLPGSKIEPTVYEFGVDDAAASRKLTSFETRADWLDETDS